MKKVEQYRSKYAGMSDNELYAKMHQWVENSENHFAAELLLKDRQKKQDRIRFHLVFWPSLIAALIAVLSFILSNLST